MQDVRPGHAGCCAVAMLALLAGCAGRGRTLNVAQTQEKKLTVEMKARSFAFDPDVIVAQKADTLVLDVTNV
jgi:hypothetical protein